MENIERINKRMKKWEKTRTKKWSFILSFGVLCWGIPVGLLIYLIDISFDLSRIQLSYLVARLIVFMILGLIFGFFHFQMNDRRYRRWKEETRY